VPPPLPDPHAASRTIATIAAIKAALGPIFPRRYRFIISPQSYESVAVSAAESSGQVQGHVSIPNSSGVRFQFTIMGFPAISSQP
jgi:hypothetical protein